MTSLRACIVAITVFSVALAGCSLPEPSPVESTGPTPTLSVTQPAPEATPTPTANPTPGTLEGRIAAGEILVDIPADWGTPQPGGQVDEGYILQDFTWSVGSDGTTVSTVGLTLGQGQGLSGGETFDEHVAGMVDVLTVDGQPAPTVTTSTVNGTDAARICAPLEDRDMLVVLYLYDLGDLYYEFGYYQASGETNGGVLLAEFDEVAETFTALR